MSPVPEEPSAAAVLRARYARRLLARLSDLAGPVHGTVELPVHVARTGRRSYSLQRPRSRMSLYRTVLTEGEQADVPTFLHADLLLEQWPVLRTLPDQQACAGRVGGALH
ncbi:hypothetical protein GCM10010245_91370 [Streptomyces spectabilis]|nr:hypothetical protein GCM10010245_91370 [Streptomyces spectabilis]